MYKRLNDMGDIGLIKVNPGSLESWKVAVWMGLARWEWELIPVRMCWMVVSLQMC